MVFYCNERDIEYDFVLAPGADPPSIRLAFSGASKLELDAGGDLLLHPAWGDPVRMKRPVLYQQDGDERQEVSGGYVLGEAGQVAFQVGAYDPKKPLVVDPVLVYSTYWGGSYLEGGYGIAADSSGSAYVVGTTSSPDFPTVNPLQAVLANPSPPLYDSGDLFVAKFSPSGSVVYATYLGGTGNESAGGIAVDAAGSAYLVGTTGSTDFPTVNAFQSSLRGTSDAVVVKLNPAGSALVYSTYLGGSGGENGNGIALDDQRKAYVAGTTQSNDFPVLYPLQANYGGGTDAFVAKLDQFGSALVYSTYLGGSGEERLYGPQAIAVDTSGNSYVVGGTDSPNLPVSNALQSSLAGAYDFFVAKINAAGSAFEYATYLGGSHASGGGIAVDSSGAAYITGSASAGFPVVNALQPDLKNGYQNAVVAKLNRSGSALVYSTYLGGSVSSPFFFYGEVGRAIAVDGAGAAYVVGTAGTTDFPLANPIQGDKKGSLSPFVSKLSPDGSALIFSTYFGTTCLGFSCDLGWGIAVDGQGQIYATGQVWGNDLTTVNAAQSAPTGYRGLGWSNIAEAFVAKINLGSDTSTGSGVAVQPLDGSTGGTPVTVTFSSVTQAGITSLATSSTGPAPPFGFQLGNPPTYFDLTTTAQFVAPIQVCVNYTGVSYPDESQLELFHNEGGQWVNQTVSLDTVNHVVCASVTSLSPFAILQPTSSAASFVTGGGWINSPIGAYTQNPGLTGKANFSINSKYQKGSTVPTGETEVNLSLANFDFHSASYQSLVVVGAKAQYAGIGRINGTGIYNFLLTAMDAGGVDGFRIKITSQSGDVVYDSMPGSPDDPNAFTPAAIGGGSIVIHK